MATIIRPARALSGTVQVPGDKSIAHRALILGALARGTQVISGLPRSADVSSTAACLRALGYRIEEDAEGRTLVGEGGEVIAGRASADAAEPELVLDAGNSGTTARLLSGLLAGLGRTCSIDGDDSLRRRPMERIAEPLRLMGADIRTGPGGCLPLCFSLGAPLQSITYQPPVASAQVKSAILIAGLHAAGSTTVNEIAQTRDHTENMLAAMGVSVARSGNSITVFGEVRPQAVAVTVPGDVSSAAFFLAAGSLLPGSEVRLPGVGVNPTRCGALQVLCEMGADIVRSNEETVAGEAIADLMVRGSRLRGVEIGGAIIPALIDELPVLAVVASQAEGVTTVRDAEELRHKESDRIQTMVENLTRLGADITERPDGFVIRGPSRLHGGVVSAHGDHRIAMAMAVAGLIASGETQIENSDVAGVSYPEFFTDLARLAQPLNGETGAGGISTAR